MSRPAALLRGVDLASFAVALCVRLRTAGVPVALSSVADLVAAWGVAPPTTRSALRRTCRVTLCRRHADHPVFDAVFDAVFGDAVLPVDPHARRTGTPDRAEDALAHVDGDDAGEAVEGALPWVTLPPAVAAGGEDDAAELAVPLRLPSELGALADQPFEALGPAEAAEVAHHLAGLTPAWPTRRTRRLAPDHRGRGVALRPTLARARRTGFEPVELVRTRAVQRRRRVVVLCDVSQSMQAQAAAWLHLMRGLVLTGDAEVFAFATRLTRLTPVLAHRDAPTALAQATALVDDRFGGTRVASSLGTLLASRHGGLLRGAVVVVASDGWDADPPADLARATARLHRRAHRVLWANPRAGAPGFAPRTTTMAAALPHCDQLLPAATVTDLAGVLAALARV